MKHILSGVLALLAAPLALVAVNINTAMMAELEALPGIGPAKVKVVVAYRQQNGQFKTVEDLKKVKDTGEGILSKLKDEVSVASPAAKKVMSTVRQR